jgi:hypothetical protein
MTFKSAWVLAVAFAAAGWIGRSFITRFRSRSIASTALQRTEIEHMIDAHLEQVLVAFHGPRLECGGWVTGVAEFDWLPHHIIKAWLTRLPGAAALQACIREYDLRLVVVPEKVLYESTCGRHRFVVAQRMRGTLDGTMTLLQAVEVCFLLENATFEGAYFWDARPSNLIFCQDMGTVAFIDTETAGFRAPSPSWGLARILDHNLDADAREFVEARYKFHRSQPCPVKRSKGLDGIVRYPEVDLATVVLLSPAAGAAEVAEHVSEEAYPEQK